LSLLRVRPEVQPVQFILKVQQHHDKKGYFVYSRAVGYSTALFTQPRSTAATIPSIKMAVAPTIALLLPNMVLSSRFATNHKSSRNSMCKQSSRDSARVRLVALMTETTDLHQLIGFFYVGERKKRDFFN
jgi:hypothetical protein